MLEGVSWQRYEQLLRDVGDSATRLTFNDGQLEIMSPLLPHERWRKRIDRMIGILPLELNFPMEPLGSTTFRREDLAKGLEPDECYYIKHATDIRDKDTLDLTQDPPPDLAVEVDITHRSLDREPIYAALGIGEPWRFTGSRLAVMKLNDEGVYSEVSQSDVFSFLPMTAFNSFLLRMEQEEQTAVLREFRDWVKTLGHA